MSYPSYYDESYSALIILCIVSLMHRTLNAAIDDFVENVNGENEIYTFWYSYMILSI